MIEGVDVSSWQGEIDWPVVAAAGKRFVIIRSGDGWYLDPRFKSNLQGAADAGLHIEVYHYLRFWVPSSEMFGICFRQFEVAQRYGAKRLWLDWEDTSDYSKVMAVDQRWAWAGNLLLSLSDMPRGHYTGTWWWNPYMNSWNGLKDEPMWIGQYPLWNNCRSDPTAAGMKPTLPDSWSNWLIWQYTSKGTCPGIEGAVDLNVAQDALLEGETMIDWPLERAKLERDFQAWLVHFPLTQEEKEDSLRQTIEQGRAAEFYQKQIAWRLPGIAE